MRRLLFLVVLFSATQLFAQGLFDNAVENERQASPSQNYELNGYLRSVFYGGKIADTDDYEMKSGYGEAALKLRFRKESFGDAFAEVRFRKGLEFNENLAEVNLREAYINAYVGKFDFRVGHQIVVWGRADGFNPTDNVSPKNMLVRSPNEDDKREGSFVVRSFFNLTPLRFEGIWVPAFFSSVLPLQAISLPEGISITDPDYPDANLKNGAYAIRLNLELPSLDCSISYFNGFNPLPGVDMGTPYFTMSGLEMSLIPKAYRMNIFGADFSTTLGSFGLRGEFAYREPHKDFMSFVHIPNPELQYVFGFDKEIGDFSLICQYVGKYVRDFEDLSAPVNPLELPEYEVRLKNRMLSSQLDELNHAVSFRPAFKLMHETLNLELLGLYNFTTEEYLCRPKVSYDIADELDFAIGGEIYAGPDGTLFGEMDNFLTAIFFELKSSF